MCCCCRTDHSGSGSGCASSSSRLALSPSRQTCLSRAGRASSRALTGGQPQRSGVAHRDWPPPMAAVHKGLCSRPCQGSHVRERKVERIHAVHGANVVAVSQTSHSPYWGMHFSSNGGANALVCTVSDSGGAAGGRGPVVLVTSGVRCFSPTTLRCRTPCSRSHESLRTRPPATCPPRACSQGRAGLHSLPRCHRREARSHESANVVV